MVPKEKPAGNVAAPTLGGLLEKKRTVRHERQMSQNTGKTWESTFIGLAGPRKIILGIKVVKSVKDQTEKELVCFISTLVEVTLKNC